MSWGIETGVGHRVEFRRNPVESAETGVSYHLTQNTWYKTYDRAHCFSFEKSLRRLTLREMLDRGNYADLLPALRNLSLDRLDIEEPDEPPCCKTLKPENGSDQSGNRLAKTVMVTNK